MDTHTMNDETAGNGASGKLRLSGRAILSLTVMGASLFLLLCLAGYGEREALSALPKSGVTDKVASWVVPHLGAGAWVVAILGLAWSAIVYFQEQTPDLLLRGAGTAMLAGSSALLAGLIGGSTGRIWGGNLGAEFAGFLSAKGGLAVGAGWLLAATTFMVGLFIATDSVFRTLRKSGRSVIDPRMIPVEPQTAELRDDPSVPATREFVRTDPRTLPIPVRTIVAAPVPFEAAEPVASNGEEIDEDPIHVPSVVADSSAFDATIEDDELPGRPLTRNVSVAIESEPSDDSIFASRDELRRSGEPRGFVTTPQGYRGVEFLPTNDDLAIPAPAEPESSDVSLDVSYGEREVVGFVDSFLDDAIGVPAQEAEPTPAAEPVAAAPAAATTPPAAEILAEEESGSGIGYASGVTFLDDEIAIEIPEIDPSFLSQFQNAPGDGASAADDLASRYGIPASRGSSLAAIEAFSLPRMSSPDSAIAPTSMSDLDDDDSREMDTGPLFEEEFVGVADASIEDDVIYSFDEPAPRSSVIDAINRAAPASHTPVPPSPLQPSFEEQVSALAVATQSLAADASAFAAEVASADASSGPAVAVAEPPVAVQAQATPVVVDVAAPSPVVELWDFPRIERTAIDESAAALQAESATPVRTPVPEDEAVTTEVSPVVTPAPDTPSALSSVATSAAAVADPVAEQLGLFPSSCDLSKLHGMELDPLFNDAVEAILTKSRASAIVLQRSLGVGYARALRILDQMTEAGMLGPDAAGGAREILFTRRQWDAR